MEVDIYKVVFVLHAKQYIAEDTVVPEHILVFEIAAVAPSMHYHDQFVEYIVKIRSNVELSCVVRALCIAYKMLVDVNIRAARNAEERKDISLALVVFTGIEDGPVDTDEVVLFLRSPPLRPDAVVSALQAENSAYRILFRDLRRIIRKLVS